MIGAIIGDIVGSRFEFQNTDSKEFELFHDDCDFTDDTVMTIAVAESIMRCFNATGSYDDLDAFAVSWIHRVGRRYPFCGYGGRFYRWMLGDNWAPYNSYGNGSAMRISAVGDIAKTVEEAKYLSDQLTCISHDHPEGMKGAEAVAVAKTLLRLGVKKDNVIDYIYHTYYRLDKTVNDYRKENNGQHGKEICQVTVPQAFVCFKEGKNFEDVIRNCVSIGGDSDTIGAIAGGIAEAYYKVSKKMQKEAKAYLTPDLLNIVNRWEKFVEEVNGQNG